jgi:hypothetical protein
MKEGGFVNYLDVTKYQCGSLYYKLHYFFQIFTLVA